MVQGEFSLDGALYEVYVILFTLFEILSDADLTHQSPARPRL